MPLVVSSLGGVRVVLQETRGTRSAEPEGRTGAAQALRRPRTRLASVRAAVSVSQDRHGPVADPAQRDPGVPGAVELSRRRREAGSDRAHPRDGRGVAQGHPRKDKGED